MDLADRFALTITQNANRQKAFRSSVLALEHSLESGQAAIDVDVVAARTHKPYSPLLTGKLAEASTHLEIELI